MTHSLDTASGWQTLKAVAGLCAETFGDRFLAGYAMGSLARGGFSHLVSDVDFGLLIHGPIVDEDNQFVAAIQQQVIDSELPLRERLSIFWGSPASLRGEEPGGRFPPFDTLDLLEHACLINGRDAREGIPHPPARALEVDGIVFALNYLGAEERMIEYREPARLLDKGKLHLSKTVLYPARFLFTLQTGRVAGNDVAVEKYTDENIGPDVELLKAAYGWRQGESLDRASAGHLLNNGLAMLYRKFLEAYLQRMREYDEKTLVKRIVAWLGQLR